MCPWFLNARVIPSLCTRSSLTAILLTVLFVFWNYNTYHFLLYIKTGWPRDFDHTFVWPSINQLLPQLNPRVEYLPTAFWKEENYSKYPIWVQICCEGTSQVGNARSLGHAESKRGPVNTKSGLVMDRRAKDSDGLLCVRACVCRAASSSSASAYSSTATDRPHTGLLCHLLQ